MSAREPMLEVVNLSVELRRGRQASAILKGLDMTVARGEAFGVVGESGSGKSTLVNAIMRTLPASGHLSGGTVRIDGCDLYGLKPGELRSLRARRISVVAQNPAAALNPSMRLEAQLLEVFVPFPEIGHRQAVAKLQTILERVGLSATRQFLHRYPHQVSGGQQQRILLAMALVTDPSLLILDEATTGLDARVERDVLQLVRELHDELGFALIAISHDVNVIRNLTDRTGVLRGGAFIEVASTDALLRNPSHPYTRDLLQCVPTLEHDRLLRPIVPMYQERTAPTQEAAHGEGLAAASTNRHRVQSALLRLRGVTRDYGDGGVLGIDLEIRPGETLGLVGESGSGKSTLARLIAGIEVPDAGSIEFGTSAIAWPLSRRDRSLIGRIQMVFQNPDSSLNPAHSVEQLLQRSIRKLASRKTPLDALRQVRLDERMLKLLPARLSGGQKQRVAIARALVSEPALVLCDEMVSSLDVSVQASVLLLLSELQRHSETSFLFISHDLRVVHYISDRIAVMYRGRIVELGPAADVIHQPRHPYTASLIAAADLHARADSLPLPGIPADWQERHALGRGHWQQVTPEHSVLTYGAVQAAIPSAPHAPPPIAEGARHAA